VEELLGEVFSAEFCATMADAARTTKAATDIAIGLELFAIFGFAANSTPTLVF
jgi:hypothetical protein